MTSQLGRRRGLRPGDRGDARAIRRCASLLAVAAIVLVSGCSEADESSSEAAYYPSEVEAVAGLDVKRVTLTEDGAKRISLETGVAAQSGELTVAPYAALIYDGLGAPWVYVSEESLSFLRREIVVDRIEGDSVLISDGLEPGERVATIGATEIYGTELGIEGDH